MRTIKLSRSTVVAASPEAVWAEVSTLSGVNTELMPWCRMHEPRSLRGRTIDSWKPGESAVCWLLAAGVLPFDRHVLQLESVTPGAGFVEESTSALQRRWRHQRTLEPVDDGCRVTDRLTIVPRLSAATPMTRAIVTRMFAHRHRRLATTFGART